MSDITLRQLYAFCREHAVDAEIHIKPDGRGGLHFRRDLDGSHFPAPEFDFERDVEHLPERSLATVRIKPPRSEEERKRLETPR